MSEAWADILLFGSAQNNKNLVEDIEFLLAITFRPIPFSGCREEVENS